MAAFAANLEFAALPAAVVRKIKVHVLDVIGVALAASATEFGARALRVGCAGGAGTCSLIGAREQLSAEWAALVNGTLAHGLDYDDTHTESVVHVSASVVPAGLAACEEAKADGQALLTALAIGMEANIRIGLVAPGGFHDHGFHPTGICGTFACALLASKLAGAPAAQMADALGLAGSQAAGSLEFLTDGTWAKRIHAGWAAHGGLVAARFAAGGFSGPRGVLDGRFGLYRSHLGNSGWDLSALTEDLGRRWHLLDIALKPYPCCHFNHAFIDCAQALRQAHALTVEAIEAVECHIAAREVPIVCEPQATKRKPQTDYDAKFSLPYAVASVLARGHLDVDDFTDTAIHEPAVLALAERVVYREDPESDFPRHFPGRLRIRLRDGRVLEHYEPINRGSAEHPLSDSEVREKFRRNAGRVLAGDAVEAVISAIDAIERLPDLTRLMAPLRAVLP